MKTQTRQGQLKIDFKRTPKQLMPKSPFMPLTKGSNVLTAPGTSAGAHHEFGPTESPDLQSVLPMTATVANDYMTEGPTAGDILSQSAHIKSGILSRSVPFSLSPSKQMMLESVSIQGGFSAQQQESVMAHKSRDSPDKNEKFVYVQPHSLGQDTSRVVKKRHHGKMIAYIKKLEAMVKEQKRTNDKLQQNVKERRDAVNKQKNLTDRIQAFDAKRFEMNATLSMSFDPASGFNPSISVNGMTENLSSARLSPMKNTVSSIDHTLERSQQQEQVHTLYTRLIQNDLKTSQQKTQAQLSIEKSNVESAHRNVEELQEDNKALKKQIKRTKQVLQEKYKQVRARAKKEQEREKAGAAGRNSDIDSTSLKDVDNHSVASLSALGGYATSRIDIKKVEMINQNVQQVLLAKMPLEAMQQVLQTYKAAFKNIARATIFVINRYLQAYVFKDMHEHKRFYKAIQMGDRSEIVYAIFNDEKEYCKPQFGSLQAAGKPQYAQRLIYIPVFYDQLLMFAVQMESDAMPQRDMQSKKTDEAGQHSPMKNIETAVSVASQLKLARSMTVGMHSKGSQSSRMSEGFSVGRRAASQLRSLWTHNDFAVCKIIAVLAKSRMQIFSNTISRELKQQMKSRVIKFVLGFIQHRTFRSVIKHMKTDLPKLFGFGHAEVFLFDRPQKNLYCMSVRVDDQSQESGLAHRGFEAEFIINERQIVRFPTNMGVSGYALRGDAVCFINNFAHKRQSIIGPIVAQTSSSRHQVLSLAQQAFIGHLLAKKFPYNRKIDNFLELDNIDNMAICSIQDEEVTGRTRPVGVLQLYNRVASDILHDDLVRIHHIRKLIGAMLIKCEMYAITLELTVGMAQNMDAQKRLRSQAESLTFTHMNSLKQSVQTMQRHLEEGQEEGNAPSTSQSQAKQESDEPPAATPATE